MLRRAPERVRGLILMDTRAEADTPEGRKARDAAMAQAREGGARAIADAMLPKLLARNTAAASPALVRRVRETMERTPVAGILGALSALKERPDSFPLLPTLNIPVLVLVGEDDQITPRERAQAMADAIPGARLVVIPGAGHLPPMEQPETTTRVLSEFLGSLAGGG